MLKAIELAAEGAPSTPAYILDTAALTRNAERICALARDLGLTVLLSIGDLPDPVLSHMAEWAGGASARTLAEARLGRRILGGAVFLNTAGCRREDIPEILACCSHVSLRSQEQARRHRPALQARGVQLGLTVPPQELPALSRAGFSSLLESGVRGLRLAFPPTAAREILRFLEDRGETLGRFLGWLNLGQAFPLLDGERAAYDAEMLREIRKVWDGAIFLETGQEAARGAVYLTCTVLDVLPGPPATAILDAAAPIPKPGRPGVLGAGYPGEKPYNLRLMGITGSQWDVFGDYSFDRPLHPGQRLVMTDMAPFAAASERSGSPAPFIEAG